MNRGIFLFSTLLLLAALMWGCDYERMVDQDSVRRYERAMPDADTGAVPVHGGEARFRMAPEGSLSNPVPHAPESAARGEIAYGYYCVHCHGVKFNGDGTVGQSFSPLPADLRSAAVQAMSDDALFRTISYGGNRTPPLAYTIVIEDRWHIINWIRSLGVREDSAELIPSGDFPLK